MSLLIDTHALIWRSKNSPPACHGCEGTIAAPHNALWVSAASMNSLAFSGMLAGRIPQDLERHGFRELPVSVRHALAVRELPLHHRDPFDRMLLAQAHCEDFTILTVDAAA